MKRIFIEPLENRIAPATLIGLNTVKYIDLDGDDVTVKFSFNFSSPGAMGAVLTFNTGNIDEDATNDTPQQLQMIDLSSYDYLTQKGIGVTVTAKRNALRGGDGFADPIRLVGFTNVIQHHRRGKNHCDRVHDRRI